ncbi:3D domain-containing protein [Patescibacteria group bacterium]|nr:3D domain-containing protein [Patescibacteria group bacterium]
MNKEHLFIKIMIVILFLTGLLMGLAISSGKECPEYFNREDVFLITYNSPILIKKQTYATITAYNTVPEQTWGDPCISASGDNICGKKNIVACPRSIPLGTWVIIDNEYYQCLDRLALKYDDRFDISFDKDIEGAKEFGKQNKEVLIIK